MVRYPEVWVADYLQNMRSRCPSMRKPEVKQVSSNGRERLRECADISLTVVRTGSVSVSNARSHYSVHPIEATSYPKSTLLAPTSLPFRFPDSKFRHVTGVRYNYNLKSSPKPGIYFSRVCVYQSKAMRSYLNGEPHIYSIWNPFYLTLLTAITFLV